ncbi:MAG: DUF6125 family protein [Chloroflexi bacterium]|nr:DUF6125 family protein [Chloroflexota bacterium]
MAELNDYNGKFDPDIKYEDFSREVLLKTIREYAAFVKRLDGVWYLTVKAEMGDDMAARCDRLVWDRMEVNDARTVCNIFGIDGHDVDALLKTFQLSPGIQNIKYHMESEGGRRGILTITHCPTLVALEAEGEGRERRICREIETEHFQLRARFINPAIKVMPLKLPPRQDHDEIHCQWEFRLE